MPIEAILNWFEVNGQWLSVLAIGSVFSFMATLVAIPVIVVHIPENYFLHEKRRPYHRQNALPGIKLLLAIIKKIFGIVFVLAGIAMLVLPGQGLLTILIGLMLVNFPGKYGLERRLMRQKNVLRSVNWMRARANRPPLRLARAPGVVCQRFHARPSQPRCPRLGRGRSRARRAARAACSAKGQETVLKRHHLSHPSRSGTVRPALSHGF